MPVGLRARRAAGAPRSRRATTPAPRPPGGGCCASSAPTASASSCSAPSRATTAAATGCWPSWPSGWACRAWPPATCTRTTRSRVALQDAFVAVRLGRHARRVRAAAARQLLARAGAAGGDGRALRATTPRRWPRAGRLAERLRFDLTAGPRLPLPRLRGSRGRPQAGRALPSRIDERYAGRAALDAARGPARRGAARDPPRSSCRASSCSTATCSSWRARWRCEVRGPDTARALLPPGRGRGSSVSSIVCYLTGLSHVDPIENELLPRALPQRGAHRAARHRPRLPARHPRRADPARARPLRARALRRSWPPSPPTRCASARARLRQGARPAAGRDRAAGARGRPLEGSGSRTTSIAATCREPARRAGRRSRAWRATRWDLPRHVSQHPGGMVISTEPLIDLCPVQPASMEGRQMVQWDKDSCADAGFLKIDLLGPGDAVGGRALRRRDRARARRAHRPVAHPLRRRAGLRADPGGRDHGRVPDREPRADADAQAHAARSRSTT